MIALRVAADPFKKVKKMIKDLIVKLMEEATAEAETKGFCDTEMSTNEHTRKEKTSQVETLTADIDVLKEFYDKAGKATALVQQPEIFDDTPYKGLGGESGGVVGMIEVIASDFARLESETSASETASQEEYDKFMQDSKMDKTLKSKDMEHATEKKANQEAALQEKKSDLEGTQKELDAAMKYFDKLKPTCISGGEESFEDRTAQRKE